MLLKTFLAGLSPSIARQVISKGRPTTLDKAIEDSMAVEEASCVGGSAENKCHSLKGRQG